MKRSFRLRMALLSALLSGVALSAFAISAWWLIRAGKIERLQSDVRLQAEREAPRLRDAADWQRIEARLVSEIGIRDNQDLILLVEDREGSTVYRSAEWPRSLDTDDFPWPPWRPDAANRNQDPQTQRAGRLRSERLKSEQTPPPEARPTPPPLSRSYSKTAGNRIWHIGLATSAQSRVAVAVDGAAVHDDMAGILKAFLVALPLCLVLIGLGGWLFSARALMPLRKLTHAAQKVTAQGLDQRISLDGEDREFGELIQVFNGMLERLERSFQQACRFSADAAHELKTPLAILQGQLERAIHMVDDGSSMQAQLTGILDEVRRLSTISRKLLLLSQADVGALRVHAAPFDLSRTLEELLEDTIMLAPHLLITGQIDPALLVQADQSLLPQVLHNLISNAIKYNRDHGWVRIEASQREQQVQVLVSNSCHGIPPSERDKLFERFFRAAATRNHPVEGVGLGLSVAREIARAHGGDLVLRVELDGVAQFCLSLPPAETLPQAAPSSTRQ